MDDLFIDRWKGGEVCIYVNCCVCACVWKDFGVPVADAISIKYSFLVLP